MMFDSLSAFAQMGGHGFLSEGVDAYPTFFLNIWSMMEAGRYEEANSEWERTVQPMRDFDAKIMKISGGEGRMEKGISEIMGLPMGPPRPPSLWRQSRGVPCPAS